MKNEQLWMSRLFILCAILALLPACQRSSQKTVVSFALAGDVAELAAYQTLIEAFEESHPEIEIQLRHSPSRHDFQQKLVTMFDGGQPPDVVLLNYRRFPRFAAEGDLRPIASHLDELGFNQGAFYPVAVSAFTWQEELWCVPQNISSLVVYYNQDLFEAAQVAYPAADWKWEDFLQTAQVLAADDVYGAAIDPNLYRLAPLVWQANGVLFEKELGLLPSVPENVDAFERLVDLQTNYGVVPDRIAAESQSLEDRFVAGNVAMFFDSRRLTPALRAAADFRWDVAALPKGERRAGVLHSDGYCLGGEPSQATLAFIRFAVSVEGQTIMARTGRTVPSHIDVAESAAFLDGNQLPANSRVWLDGVGDLQHVPLHPAWIQLEEMASVEIEEAFYGRISTQEALDRIKSLSEPVLP